MKKLLLWAIGLPVLVVVLVLALVWILAGRLIAKGIEAGGTLVTQCPVTVESASLQPLRGTLRIRGLTLANPEGFKTAQALAVEEIRVALAPRSLLAPVVRVREVAIEKPRITYEIGLGKTNIGTIQRQIEAFIKSVPTDPGKPEHGGEEKPGRRTTIDLVRIADGTVAFSGTLLRGAALPVPLPTIELRDLGHESPVTTSQATAEILARILQGVVEAATESGQTVDGVLRGVGEVLKSSGEELKQGVGKAVDKLKGILERD